jgi:hypothetical protein
MNPIVWLDDIGKPAWIALMIVSFVLFWPAGFVVLGYLIGSGRMGCGFHHHRDGDRWQDRMQRMQERMRDKTARWEQRWGMSSRPASSGNRAFDEYRTETLRRLEDEERQFREFLDRLRHAKDKAEFDEFMAEMRRRPTPEQGPHTEV